MVSIIFIHLFHIIFIGGLFLYVGILKNNINKWLYTVLFYLGILLIIYQTYKLFNLKKDSLYYWVYYFHIFIIAPLIIYIGFNKENTPRYCYEFLLMLAFAVIGYHTYYLFNE